MTEKERWNRLNILMCEAEYQYFKYGSANLEWELGVDIVQELTREVTLINDEVEISVLMGIPVRINYRNPDIIKLWRQVTV